MKWYFDFYMCEMSSACYSYCARLLIIISKELHNRIYVRHEFCGYNFPYVRRPV